jgi:hypothetical protein
MRSHYDSSTVSEVKCYQHYYGFTNDGITGISTWTLLGEDLIPLTCSCGGCQYGTVDTNLQHFILIQQANAGCHASATAILYCDLSSGELVYLNAGRADGDAYFSPGDCE